MGPLSAFLGMRGRDPEDMKETRLTPEQEHAVAMLRARLTAGDRGGPISLAGPTQAPPPESALRGGFYAPPQGPAPAALPFRPPGQPVAEPPPRGLLARLYGGR